MTILLKKIQFKVCHLIRNENRIFQYTLRRNGLSNVSIENIRNVGVFAHIDAGKTTTSEQILFLSGKTKSIGRVDTGDTVMDFLPQERERGITISSAAVTFNWMNDILINLIDTPGHVDFTVEVERSARVLDGGILVIDAVAGVQAQTRTVWKQLNRNKIPTIAFINKMDRDGACFHRSTKSIRTKLGSNVVSIQYPVFESDESEETFIGVIDLVSMKKITWPLSNTSNRIPSSPIFENVCLNSGNYQLYSKARIEMLESLAEVDEIFFEIFTNTQDDMIKEVDIISAIRRCCINNSVIPALCGSALRSKGIELLLNSVVAFLPCPSDRPPAVAFDKAFADKTIEVDSSGKDLFAFAFKIVFDKDKGPMTFVRIYSGVLLNKQSLFNSSKSQKERINQLYIVEADDMVISDKLVSGQVGCIVGLKHTTTGDTLIEVSSRARLENYVLHRLVIPPPVYSVSIEPEKSIQEKDLLSALQILHLEDPSLIVEVDKECGQTIIRGIGELHLEIICDKLERDYNIEVSTGKAYVSYRETIKDIYDIVNPIDKVITFDRMIGMKRLFAQVAFQIISFKSHDEAIIEISPNVKSKCTNEEYITLLESLSNVCTRSPSNYPIVGIKVNVIDIVKDSDTNSGALKACCSLLIETLFCDNSIRQILEPVMSIEIDLPVHYIGDVINDLSVRRRGVITEVITENNHAIITGDVPLATMLGYSTDIRSMTQGEGFFTMEYKQHSQISTENVF